MATGDPLGAGTWSGTPAGVARGLRAHGASVTGVDATPPAGVRHVALVGRTGWDVQWAVANSPTGRNRYVDRLTLRRAREFLALQWHVLAHAD